MVTMTVTKQADHSSLLVQDASPTASVTEMEGPLPQRQGLQCTAVAAMIILLDQRNDRCVPLATALHSDPTSAQAVTG